MGYLLHDEWHDWWRHVCGVIFSSTVILAIELFEVFRENNKVRYVSKKKNGILYIPFGQNIWSAFTVV